MTDDTNTSGQRPRQPRTGLTSTGARKASAKSTRSRAREFALQALYQHLVGRNDAVSIDQFTRDLAIGRSRFVEETQRELNLGQEEASRLLAAAIAAGNSEDKPLREVVRRTAEELSLGIERSFAFLRGSGDAERLDALMLSGGGAGMPLLREFLAERHNVPVHVTDPLRQLSYDAELFKQPVQEVAPLLAVGVGLGLRRME